MIGSSVRKNITNVSCVQNFSGSTFRLLRTTISLGSFLSISAGAIGSGMTGRIHADAVRRSAADARTIARSSISHAHDSSRAWPFGSSVGRVDELLSNTPKLVETGMPLLVEKPLVFSLAEAMRCSAVRGPSTGHSIGTSKPSSPHGERGRSRQCTPDPVGARSNWPTRRSGRTKPVNEWPPPNRWERVPWLLSPFPFQPHVRSPASTSV
jgi:hypothetical protein